MRNKIIKSSISKATVVLLVALTLIVQNATALPEFYQSVQVDASKGETSYLTESETVYDVYEKIPANYYKLYKSYQESIDYYKLYKPVEVEVNYYKVYEPYEVKEDYYAVYKPVTKEVKYYNVYEPVERAEDYYKVYKPYKVKYYKLYKPVKVFKVYKPVTKTVRYYHIYRREKVYDVYKLEDVDYYRVYRKIKVWRWPDYDLEYKYVYVGTYPEYELSRFPSYLYKKEYAYTRTEWRYIGTCTEDALWRFRGSNYKVKYKGYDWKYYTTVPESEISMYSSYYYKAKYAYSVTKTDYEFVGYYKESELSKLPSNYKFEYAKTDYEYVKTVPKSELSKYPRNWKKVYDHKEIKYKCIDTVPESELSKYPSSYKREYSHTERWVEYEYRGTYSEDEVIKIPEEWKRELDRVEKRTEYVYVGIFIESELGELPEDWKKVYNHTEVRTEYKLKGVYSEDELIRIPEDWKREFDHTEKEIEWEFVKVVPEAELNNYPEEWRKEFDHREVISKEMVVAELVPESELANYDYDWKELVKTEYELRYLKTITEQERDKYSDSKYVLKPKTVTSKTPVYRDYEEYEVGLDDRSTKYEVYLTIAVCGGEVEVSGNVVEKRVAGDARLIVHKEGELYGSVEVKVEAKVVGDGDAAVTGYIHVKQPYVVTTSVIGNGHIEPVQGKAEVWSEEVELRAVNHSDYVFVRWRLEGLEGNEREQDETFKFTDHTARATAIFVKPEYLIATGYRDLYCIVVYGDGVDDAAYYVEEGLVLTVEAKFEVEWYLDGCFYGFGKSVSVTANEDHVLVAKKP